MSATRPGAALAAVRSANPQHMDCEQLAGHLRDLGTLRAWLDACDIVAARRSRELSIAGAAGSVEAEVARHGRRSGKEARSVSAREAVCHEMPALEAALVDGTISAGHVDAIAHAARRLDEAGKALLIKSTAAYVDTATHSSVDAFETSMREQVKEIIAATAGDTDAELLESQRARSTVKRWVDTTTGMHHTHLELDPLRDSALWTSINAQLRRDRAAAGNQKTPWAQLQVNAFVNATKGDVNAISGSAAALPEIGVLVDYRRLVDDAVSRGVCETVDGVNLPVSTVRRLCCEANVYPIVLGTQGEVLDAGRTARTANRQQRRALAAMHRTCGHPDCTVGFDACRMHHVRFWWRDLGPSDLDNFLPLCEQHHHLVHEGGWTLTMTPDRIATWTRPDGSTHRIGTTLDRSDAPSDRLVERPDRTDTLVDRADGPSRASPTPGRQSSG